MVSDSPYQFQLRGNSSEDLFAVENVPPLGVRGHNFTEETEYEPVKVTTDRNNNIVMENAFIQATFDKSGHLIGLTDKKLKYGYLSYMLWLLYSSSTLFLVDH